MNKEIEKLKKKYQTISKELNVPLSYENKQEIRKHLSHKANNDLKDYTPKIDKIDKKLIRAILVPKEEKLTKEKLERNLKIVGSKYAYQAYYDSSLENFYKTNDERKKAFEIANEFLDDFKENKASYGLYISGNNQTGKTYLASSIANYLAEDVHNYKVSFVFYPDFKRIAMTSRNDNSLEEKIITLKRAELLVIDDFASGKTTQWVRDSVLLPIINERINNKRPTIFTSNSTIDDLFTTLSDPDNKSTVEIESVRRFVFRVSNFSKVITMDKRLARIEKGMVK